MVRLVGGDGVEYGPVSAEQLRQWIAEGRVSSRTQIRADGQPDWRPLQSFPELLLATGPTIANAAAPPSPWTPPGAPVSRDIPNYLVQSILVTLFCCIPFGIPAIVNAARVDTKVMAGDLAGALESSRRARMWCWWAFLPSALAVGLYLLVAFIAIVLEGGAR
jgi:Interferon-induced transmembrane protein/GYF domain 2